jgi:hypothetical protein
LRDPISKNSITKNWAGGVAQGENPEFKPQYHTQKKKIKKISIIQIFPTLFFAVFQFEFRALNLLGRHTTI